MKFLRVQDNEDMVKSSDEFEYPDVLRRADD